MHLLGALLLVAATSYMGFARAMEVRKKPTFLRMIARALTLLKHEIVAKSSELPNAVSHVSVHCGDEIRPFFYSVSSKLENAKGSFAEIWIEETYSLPGLNKQEMELLAQLGFHLGKYDAASQKNALDQCIDSFHSLADEASRNARQYSRLYAGIGLTIGSMLAVALY